VHRPLTFLLLTLSLLLTASCGGDDRANSPRSAAEAFVAALRDQDWAAACDVSVHDGRDACIKLLKRAYGRGAELPTVADAEKIVEKHNGRCLVHYEVVVIE
jgi:hypothetical protein